MNPVLSDNKVLDCNKLVINRGFRGGK